MTDKAKLKQQIEDMEAKLEEMRNELDKAEKWEPEGGGFTVLGDGDIAEAETTYGYRIFGTERKTRDAAEKARDEMRTFNRLLAYRDEFAPGYDPDWTDVSTNKWCVFYNYSADEWYADSWSITKVSGAVYMPKDVAGELVRKLNSGEVVL